MVEVLLYGLHILVCVAMLPIILLQAGKGGGVSASFGGGGSAGSVLGGSRGASTFLTKLTSFAAVIFMITSLGLAYTSSRSKSVVGDVPPIEGAPSGAPGLQQQPEGGDKPATSTPAAP